MDQQIRIGAMAMVDAARKVRTHAKQLDDGSRIYRLRDAAMVYIKDQHKAHNRSKNARGWA